MNMTIGEKIKKRRLELNLTLRDLAQKTQLTPAFLSQLENGKTNTSLNSLQRISDALCIPMMHFLTNSAQRSPLVKAENRSLLDLDDHRVIYQLLCPSLDGKMEALLGQVTNACGENICRQLPVETEEFIFVLEGLLIVELNQTRYELRTGDSIYFNGRDLTYLASGCEGVTRWISVITPPVF